MGTPQGGGHIPSPFAADIGRGRLGRVRRPVLLERREAGGWVTAERFGSMQDAATALDDAVANGAPADQVRVTVAPARGARVATIGAIAFIVVVAAFILYFWFAA